MDACSQRPAVTCGPFGVGKSLILSLACPTWHMPSGISIFCWRRRYAKQERIHGGHMAEMIPQVILDLCSRVSALSFNPKNAQNKATFDAACRYIYLMQRWSLQAAKEACCTMELNAYLTLFSCCISSMIILGKQRHPDMSLAHCLSSLRHDHKHCHPVT